MAPVSTLDVSKNAKLLRLNISVAYLFNRHKQESSLRMLMPNMCQGTINTDVKLDAIDLTNNPDLTVFKSWRE